MPRIVHCLRAPALVALSIVLAGLASAAGARSGPAPARVMLPSNVVPVEYRIDFTPDVAHRTFTGSVEIDVDIVRPTDRIVLNSAEIEIDHAALDGEAHAPGIAVDTRIETATFTFAHTLSAGRRTLSLAYRGKIADRMAGLFARQYAAADSERSALYTQFENSDARRFVPCWDEPARKAVFRLSVTADASLMAVSNMPVAQTSPLAGGLAHVVFAPTPRMSSYLLFFALGDFERVHRDVDGTDVGVIVKRGDLARANYALDAATHLLPYYNDYFGARFPLPKLDLVAAPGSATGFGAMENWGAIFFLERDLLIDPRLSTQDDLQGVYLVIAHEMSHQWFGDLVTMAWWDDLWLNEGFASWMEIKAVDRFHPEWKMWLRALADKQWVMGVDARVGTHPVIRPIADVQQAAVAFDGITYTKGQQVIRTIEGDVGEDRFRAGVRRYMADHAMGNTTSDDLWHAVNQAGARPVTVLAHELTLQPGVPLIVERSVACAHGRTTLTLAQERFAIGAPQQGEWHMPVTVAIAGGASTQAVIHGPAAQVVTLPGCGAAILNAGQKAYFRSQYSDAGLKAALAAFATLPAEDQLGIFQDATSLALAGRAPISQVFDIATGMPADVDPVVASALIAQIDEIDRLHDDLPTQPAWREFARRLLHPMLERIGSRDRDGDADNLRSEREALLALLSQMDDPAVVADLHGQYEILRQAPEAAMVPALRAVVLDSVSLHADAATWEQLRALANSRSDTMEKSDLLRRLGSARDPALAARALDLAFSPEMQRQDGLRVLSQVAAHHPDLALDFTIAHWPQIEGGLDLGGASNYGPSLLSRANDPALVARLDTFLAAHVPANARGPAERTTAALLYRAGLRAQRVPEIDRLVAAMPPR